MKAVVLHEYGPASNLKWETFADPKVGKGEVLVRVQAASINPIDWNMRSGAWKAFFPVEFPAILGFDFAGVVSDIGEGVSGFSEGDAVFGRAAAAYAEYTIVKAEELALIPDGLDMIAAGAIPLVATTGDQLIRATKVEKGQTILLTGAVGSVGRMALFSALEIGAKVIASVRKAQINEALKAGATEAIDVNDDAAIAKLPVLDAVADTVGGTVTTKIIGKVKPGGFLATVTSAPANASEFKVTVKTISSAPDPKAYVHYGTAVRDGKLVLPIEKTFPMAEAAEAQAFAEKGNVGKVVLTA